MRRIALVLALAAAVAPLPGARAAGADPIVGIPSTNVGVHGPVAHHLDGLELVGHAPIRPAGVSQEGAGNNGGIALVDDCAYVGRWHEYRNTVTIPQRGVQIVDVDPASPTFTTVVGEVEGSLVSGATSREIRAVDLPGTKLLVLMTFSDDVANRPHQKMNTLRFFDATNCRRPTLVGTYDFLATRPHEFFVWVDPDPSHAILGRPRILVYASVPIEAPNMIVVDATIPSVPRLVGAYDAGQLVVSQEETGLLGNYLHSMSVSPDGTRAYLSYWDGGFFTVDTTALARGAGGAPVPLGLASMPYDYSPPDRGNTHSAVEIPGKNAVLVGDEVFGGNIEACPYGWLRTVSIGSATEAPRQLGEYRLDVNRPENCDPVTGTVTMKNANGAPIDGTFSMHNQTVTGRYALASWYGGGMRVFDLDDLTAPAHVGAFVPKPLETVAIQSRTRPVAPQGRTATTNDDWWVETWSYPIVRDGLIYVSDIRNGLFILRPAPGSPFAAEIAGTAFAEGNSTVGAVTPR